jgi:VWFA-related protein
MYATLDGKSVDDLQASEVEVLEDGVPQAIDAFEHVNVGATGSARARVFVVFLDTYHSQIESSSNMRLPLIKFLDRVIGQQDLVAVMTPEMPAREIAFGRKAAIVSDIMQPDWAWARGRGDRRDQKEALYDGCYATPAANSNSPAPEMKARRREKLTLDALDDLVAGLGAAREERKAVLAVSDGWVLFRENPNLSASQKQRDQSGLVERLLRRPPREKSEETGGAKEVDFVECEADRVALGALDHSMRLPLLTENANRSNISFYSIDPRGIVPSDSTNSPERPSNRRDTTNVASRQDSLRFIAENTDGVLIANSTNLDAQIARIVDDASSYYLMTYLSSNARLDGRFRAITVRVKRDRVKVRARRGYRGRTADELVSRTAAGGSTDTLTASAASSTGFNARVPFRIRTSTWLRSSAEATRQGAFWVVGELDYQTRRQLAWTAGAEAEVVVLSADGLEVMTRTVDLKADEGPFSIQVPESGTIAAGEYAVRVRIRSQADEKSELTDTARVVLRDGPALGEAVMWRRGLSTGPRYLRTADPRFMRSDRLKLELATSAALPATARTLDRNRNELSVPVQVSERADESAAFRWIVVDAALAPFAAGDYAIEVTQGREKRVTEFKIVP